MATEAFDPEVHWETAYRESPPEELSWSESEPRVSLEMIEAAGIDRDAAIIDAGGGASPLAGELLGAGFEDVTVADISAEALERARVALGPEAERIEWVEADLRDHDFGRRFDLWHDRAVLHFMVDEADRAAYVQTLRRSLAASSDAIIATFAPDGPERCSGLPVRRYDAEGLGELLGPGFELASSRPWMHRTPGGKEQSFVFAHLRRFGD